MAYACAGGPKPSYAESIRIWDAYLDAVRFENCQEDASYYSAQLRDGTYEIPAIGYDDDPSGRKGLRRRPSSAAYRLSDGMDIIWEEGFYPVVPMPGMPLGGEGRRHMRLRLRAGEYVTYTLRNTGAWRLLADCTFESLCLTVTSGEKVLFSGTPRRTENGRFEICTGAGAARVRFTVAEGTLVLNRLYIEEV